MHSNQGLVTIARTRATNIHYNLIKVIIKNLIKFENKQFILNAIVTNIFVSYLYTGMKNNNDLSFEGASDAG